VVLEVEEFLRCGPHARLRTGRLCGYDKRLCADVLEAFVVELSRSYKRRAKALLGLDSVDDALTGAVSVMQRETLRSDLRSISPKVNHQQSHVLALDSVYVRDAQTGELLFHALAAPTADEVR